MDLNLVLGSVGSIGIELVLTFLLVAANGFFVASEFALARVRSSQATHWLQEKRAGSKAVKHAVIHIDEYLAACQLGITLASLGLGAFGEPVIHEILHPVLGDSAKIGSVGIAGILAFATITVLHVVVGELAPKSAAIARTDKLVLLLMPILRVFYYTTRPLVKVFNGLGNLVIKPFGIPPASEAGTSAFSQMELLQIIRESGEGGEINDDERTLTENVFEFDDRRVREVMIPRKKIVTLEAESSLQDAAKIAVETGVTRIPICIDAEGIDSTIGVLHAKDLLSVYWDKQDKTLKELARPVLKIADSTFVAMALREMRIKRTHLAIVVDEHGTAVGIVTVEDILEELVGEIEDEFDKSEENLIRYENDTMYINGETPISDLIEALNESSENVQFHEATVGGYVLESLGVMPKVGEKGEFFGHFLQIEEVEEGRIKLLSTQHKSE